jgi:hypothetical protein
LADGVAELTEHHMVDGHPQVWRYRYATRVPLRADMYPLYVNWCEVTITTPAGELLYRNAWATDHPLPPTTLHAFVIAARTRWKSENENNNVLKNYGYHLDLRQLRPRRSILSLGLGHAQPARLPLSHGPGPL